jgi:hypothetical protein
VCQRALTLVGGQPDGPLDDQTRALVAGHLEHCAECRAIAATLTETRAVLATLVEIEPGVAFTADVVAATSGSRIPARRPKHHGLSERWAWAGELRGRVAAAWQRMLARPRLSLELAYLATVLLVVANGNPGLIADALGARTGGLLTVKETAKTADVRQSAMATERATSMMPAFVERAMREVEVKRASAAKGWSWFVDRAAQLFSASWNWLRGLFSWVGDQDAPPASTELGKPPVRASQ